MPHVQRAGDIGRRQLDAERRLGRIQAGRMRRAVGPLRRPSGLDRLRLEGLREFGHGVILEGELIVGGGPSRTVRKIATPAVPCGLSEFVDVPPVSLAFALRFVLGFALGFAPRFRFGRARPVAHLRRRVDDGGAGRLRRRQRRRRPPGGQRAAFLQHRRPEAVACRLHDRVVLLDQAVTASRPGRLCRCRQFPAGPALHRQRSALSGRPIQRQPAHRQLRALVQRRRIARLRCLGRRARNGRRPGAAALCPPGGAAVARRRHRVPRRPRALDQRPQRGGDRRRQ